MKNIDKILEICEDTFKSRKGTTFDKEANSITINFKSGSKLKLGVKVFNNWIRVSYHGMWIEIPTLKTHKHYERTLKDLKTSIRRTVKEKEEKSKGISLVKSLKKIVSPAVMVQKDHAFIGFFVPPEKATAVAELLKDVK